MQFFFNHKKHAALWIVLGVLLALVGVVVYFLFSPEESALFPKCVIYSATGLKCPGCGSQRAVHHLLHGRVGLAFGANPLLVLSIPYIVVLFYLEYLGGKQRHPSVRNMLMGYAATLLVLAMVVGYTVARNIWGW